MTGIPIHAARSDIVGSKARILRHQSVEKVRRPTSLNQRTSVLSAPFRCRPALETASEKEESSRKATGYHASALCRSGARYIRQCHSVIECAGLHCLIVRISRRFQLDNADMDLYRSSRNSSDILYPANGPNGEAIGATSQEAGVEHRQLRRSWFLHRNYSSEHVGLGSTNDHDDDASSADHDHNAESRRTDNDARSVLFVACPESNDDFEPACTTKHNRPAYGDHFSASSGSDDDYVAGVRDYDLGRCVGFPNSLSSRKAC